MAELTRNVRASQRELAAADARATLEEQTRLALWRMDAAGSAILLRENQWPFSVKGIPPQPPAKLHFEVRLGKLTTTDGDVAQLEELKSLLPKDGGVESVFCNAARSGESAWQAIAKDNEVLKSMAQVRNQTANQSLNRYDPGYQVESNTIEQVQRAKVVESQFSNFNNPTAMPIGSPAAPVANLRPVWLGGELVLLRSLPGETQGFQGAWLDVGQASKLLLDEIPDLLPAAALKPLTAPANDPLALVSLPFLLKRGASVPPSVPAWNGVLIAGWAAVVCAIAAVAILVRGVIRLSERRASFVSAVTHELRTPLTTFRLYSDMLETGAVKPEKRGDYLRVLSREADRLSHLVENVLAFSRIERGSARSHVSETAIEAFLTSQHERWSARLATAGLQLVIHPAPDLKLRADLTALEHILFNLIDNAAKYLGNQPAPRIEIGASTDGQETLCYVRDNGLGIEACYHEKIFGLFDKLDQQSEGSGIGLALAKRIITIHGGRLWVESDGPGSGSTFFFALPVGPLQQAAADKAGLVSG